MRVIGPISDLATSGAAKIVDFKDVDEELAYLRGQVTEWRGHPLVRDLAIQIVKDAAVPMKDKRGQALAIGKWVQENIYYIHESPEWFQTPARTLKVKAGDCDDFTTLIGSFLESVGIPSKLICMVINHVPSHIFPAAVFPDGLLPLDATMESDIYEQVNPVHWALERGKTVSLKIV